jgi:hypothetical protein
MIHLLVLAVHLLSTIAKLVRPGGSVPPGSWITVRAGKPNS